MPVNKGSFQNAVLDEISDGILIIDTDRKIIYSNSGVNKLTVKSPEEIPGSSLYEIFPGWKASVDGVIQNALQNEDNRQSIILNSGSATNLELICKFFPNADHIKQCLLIINDITARKKKEYELRLNKERYRIVAERTGKIIYEYDIEKGKIDWEGAVEKITGYSDEEFQEVDIHRWESMVHPQDRPLVLAELEKCLGNKEEFEMTYRFKKKSGEYIYIRDNGTFITPPGSNSLKMLGTMTDVTQQIMAEEELRESESKIKGILSALPDKVILQNAEGQILDFYTADKNIDPLYFLGKNYLSIAPEEVRESYQKAFEDSLETGDLQISEYATRVKGRLHHYEARFTAYEKDRVLTIIRDVTDRKSAEKALKDSEAKMRGIVEALPDKIFIHDREGNFLEYYAHPDSLVMPEEKFLHKNLFDVLPGSLNKYKKAFREAVQTGKMAIAEYDARIKSGVRTFETRIVSYEKDRLLAIVRDIDDKKKAEKELLRHSRLLQGIADAAVALLANIDDKEAITTAMSKIGEMAEADRVYIFQNEEGPEDGLHYCSQIYEWYGDRAVAQSEKKHLQNISYEETGRKRWYEVLSGGGSISGLLQHFPGDEQNLLRKQNIQSILIIPIFINQKFWGYIGFDDCTEERIWSHQERSLLWAISGSIGSFIAQKYTEEALRDSEERFDLAVQGANLGLWDWKVKENKIVYNEQWARMLGYSLEEFSPSVNTWESLIHQDDRSRVLKTLDRHLAGKTSVYECEYRLRTKDGKYRWILDKGKVFEKDENGNAVRAVGTQLDINERKLAEEALIKSEQLFSQLFRNAPVGIVMLSDESKVELVNEGFVKMFRYKPEELYNTYVEDHLVPEELQDEAQRISEEVYNGEQTFNETVRVSKDGERIPVLVYGVPVTVNTERIAIFGIYVDIRERKKAEEELQLMTKELMRTNAELEQFAYITSHNLRSPMVNLRGLLSLYEKHENDNNNFIMDKVGQSVNQLDNTLHELTEVVAIKKSIREKCDLIEFDQIVRSMESDLEEQIQSSKATIRKNFDRAPVINYPASHLRSILQNLLTNALKYRSPDRKPVIKITTRPENEFIRMSVSDNGIGIDLEKYSDKLFKMYQRLSHGGEGKGLGLYIIKSQVELLEGKIEVESKPEEGTTFHVYLKDFPE